MDWQEYELLVANIYRQLGKDVGVRVLCCGANCKRVGRSGVSHQIDVLTSHSDGVHCYQTAIECKFLSVRVNKDAVAKLAGVIEDLGIGKGVVVSKCGFTDDAIMFAKSKHIELVELRAPVDADWDGYFKDIKVTVVMECPRIHGFRFVLPKHYAGRSDVPARIRGLGTDVMFEMPDGKRETLNEITNREMDGVIDGVAGRSREFVVHFKKGTTFWTSEDTNRRQITGLIFQGERTVVSTEIEIHGEDYVAMIMRSIFDRTEHVVGTDGSIYRRPEDDLPGQ